MPVVGIYKLKILKDGHLNVNELLRDGTPGKFQSFFTHFYTFFYNKNALFLSEQ